MGEPLQTAVDDESRTRATAPVRAPDQMLELVGHGGALGARLAARGERPLAVGRTFARRGEQATDPCEPITGPEGISRPRVRRPLRPRSYCSKSQSWMAMRPWSEGTLGTFTVRAAPKSPLGTVSTASVAVGSAGM